MGVQLHDPTVVVLPESQIDLVNDRVHLSRSSAPANSKDVAVTPISLYNRAAALDVRLRNEPGNYTIGMIFGLPELLTSIQALIRERQLSNARLNTIANQANPTSVKLPQLNTDGTISFIDPPSGGSANWAVPGTIGSTTPNTGRFTALTVFPSANGTIQTWQTPAGGTAASIDSFGNMTMSGILQAGALQANGGARISHMITNTKTIGTASATDTITVGGAQVGDIVLMSRGSGAFVSANDTVQFNSTGLTGTVRALVLRITT